MRAAIADLTPVERRGFAYGILIQCTGRPGFWGVP